MQLPQLYTLFHIFFMLGIIALCTITGMPSRYWVVLGAKARRFLQQGKRKRLHQAFAAQGQAFTADESFLEQGVGLALDHQRGLVFLAQPNGKDYQSAILPKTHLGAHAAIVRQEEGFHHYFVEIADASR